MQRLQLKQSELDTGLKELDKMRLQEQQTREDLALKCEEEKVNKQKAVRKADFPGVDRADELRGREWGSNWPTCRRNSQTSKLVKPDLGDEEPDTGAGIKSPAALRPKWNGSSATSRR